MNTKNTVPATDLATEVKRAVESAPAYSLLMAAKATEAELSAKANTENEEIERLSSAVRKPDVANAAKDLLAGKPIVDMATRESIHAAQRRLAVIREAIAMQTKKVRDLENQLAHEVNNSLKRLRQPNVTRIADALKALREAAAEDARLVTELDRHHVRCGDNIAFIPISQAQYDAAWFKGVQAQGYTV